MIPLSPQHSNDLSRNRLRDERESGGLASSPVRPLYGQKEFVFSSRWRHSLRSSNIYTHIHTHDETYVTYFKPPTSVRSIFYLTVSYIVIIIEYKL